MGETDIHRLFGEICLSYYSFDDFSQKLVCADPDQSPLVFTPLASVGDGTATGAANAGFRNGSAINPAGEWCIVSAFRPDLVNLDLFYDCSTNPGQPIVFDRIPFSPGDSRESYLFWGAGFFIFGYDDGQEIKVVWTHGTSSFDSASLGSRPAAVFTIAGEADLSGRANFLLPGRHARLDPLTCQVDTIGDFPGQSLSGAYAFIQSFEDRASFGFPVRLKGFFPGDSLDGATFVPEPRLGLEVACGAAALLLFGARRRRAA